MKKEAEGNPLAPGGWSDETYYSVPAILRRRGRVVFWVVFGAAIALFTLSAAGQSDSVLHLYLKRSAGADPVHVPMGHPVRLVLRNGTRIDGKLTGVTREFLFVTETRTIEENVDGYIRRTPRVSEVKVSPGSIRVIRAEGLWEGTRPEGGTFDLTAGWQIHLGPAPQADGGAVASDSILYNIESKDGNQYMGTIVQQNSESVTIQSSVGLLTLPMTSIKSIQRVQPEQVIGGEYWFDNPQSTRYFWQPNGYGLKAGESYYQNVWVLVNQFSFGVTDNVSLALGVVPLFFFGGASTPIWGNLKFSLPSRNDRFSIGAGILSGAVLGASGESGGSSGFGIAYGLTTFGSRNSNVSFGLGYGYAGGEWANTPTLSVGGMRRTGARGYFITENYLIGTGEDPLILISLGGRRIVNRTGIDFGLFMPFQKDMGTFVAWPWLGITTPLGHASNR
jgi:hypothetical protein